jgi:homoserine O-acetyltransferase
LEGGGVLPELTIQYCTYGRLNEARDNVIWICHALTASAEAEAWWPGVIGQGCGLDTDRYFVICANILGSCYGTTGPLSMNPDKGKPYFGAFPLVTIRDMVRAHILLREHLGIEQISLLVGGSMGGYQALEWAVMEPSVIERLFLLATSANESTWGIAIHTAQRLAIEADSTWGQGRPEAGAKGLKAARAIGMLMYRNYSAYALRQTDTDTEKLDNYKASSYIQYQGEKLVKRFNAYSYWTLTKSMDSHHLARGRGGKTVAVLQSIRQPMLLIGISSDILCPVEEQRMMADHLPNCHYVEIDSPFGHDGFLVEYGAITKYLREWMAA